MARTFSRYNWCQPCGGGPGAGARENRGREDYGRREEKGREAGFPKWQEPGEKEKNFAVLHNISQMK